MKITPDQIELSNFALLDDGFVWLDFYKLNVNYLVNSNSRTEFHRLDINRK